MKGAALRTWKALRPYLPALLAVGLIAVASDAYAQTVSEEMAAKLAPAICTTVRVTTSVLFRFLALIMVLVAGALFFLGNSNAAKGIGILVLILTVAVSTFKSWAPIFIGAKIQSGSSGDTAEFDDTTHELIITCNNI